MSTILVVGNSSTTIDALSKSVRELSPGQKILFTTESVLPYKRDLLPAWLAKDIKESVLHEYIGTWLKEHQVEVVAGETINRISTKRNYLSCESKKQISFDKVLLVDSGQYFVSDIKGHQKDGVYNAYTYTSIKELAKNLLFLDNIFVRVTNFQGLNTACALARLKKEVTVLAPDALRLNIFDEETASLLKQLFESAQVRVITEDCVEILGDKEVKALKLASGKVIAAQALVFDNPKMDWRCLTDAQLTESAINVPESFLEAVQYPLPATTFGPGVINGFVMGMTVLPDGGREYLKFDGPQNIFKKIFVYQDKLIGAVCFNAPEAAKTLAQTMDAGQNIAGNEEALIEG